MTIDPKIIMIDPKIMTIDPKIMMNDPNIIKIDPEIALIDRFHPCFLMLTKRTIENRPKLFNLSYWETPFPVPGLSNAPGGGQYP